VDDLKWPKWVPPEAIDIYDFSINTSPNSEVFKKLLTENQAKIIWIELERKKIFVDDFCFNILGALDGVNSVNKTKKEYKNFHEKVRDQAIGLADLLEQCKSNLGIWAIDETQSFRLFDYDLSKLQGESKLHFLGDILKELAVEADILSKNHKESLLLPAPKKGDGKKIYFIRTLANFFRSETGNTCVSIIANCVEVCFQDFNITNKDILKLI